MFSWIISIIYHHIYKHLKDQTSNVRAALSDIPGVQLIYVAEISPPCDSSVKTLEFETESAAEVRNTVVGEAGDVELEKLNKKPGEAKFTGLKDDQEYQVRVEYALNECVLLLTWLCTRSRWAQ